MEIPAGLSVTLNIEGSSIDGSVCNGYGGDVVVAGGRLRIEALSSTDMACGEPPGIMELEAAYLGELVTATAIGVDGAELRVVTDDAELRYERLPAPPTAELVDTEWVLDTIVVGDVATAPRGAPASLLLSSDGTFRGSTGCRTFSGDWMEHGHEIVAPTWGMDTGECPADLFDQDSHVVEVIGDGFVASVEGELLTLSDPGGMALVYRAAE